MSPRYGNLLRQHTILLTNIILLWQPGSENQADIDPIMQKLASLLPEQQATKRNKDFIRSQSIRAKKS